MNAAFDAVIANMPNEPDWKAIMALYSVGELR